MSEKFSYRDEYLNEISFPLGGIGTGCIGLAGNGRLIDWEIFNRPNKGSTNGFTHFAIKAEDGDNLIDARVCQSDLNTSYTGTFSGASFREFGFGAPREYMTGVPHFKSAVFTGTFPIATIEYHDEKFPGNLKLTAFSPFIPGNDRDSTIPAAFFTFEIENTTDKSLSYTLAASLKNTFQTDGNTNQYNSAEGYPSILLDTKTFSQDALEFGDLTVATDGEDTSYQEYWYRGSWFDNLAVYWQDFVSPGKLLNRRYETKSAKDGVAYGNEDQCVLASHVNVPAQSSVEVRFIMSWNFPNMSDYWHQKAEGEKIETWKNYYATVFENSTESAVYGLKNWDRLYNQTLLFKNTLFDSTLPAEVLDAVSANISILKSPTSLRLEDGTFYGFEGCHPDSGCCEGSCTHVWNYAYALPFLFPNLERSMRDVDYAYNMDENGGMTFRLQLPLGREKQPFRPCADGQFGGVMKMYREWKVSGDTEWLRSHWESIKKNISFAWSETNHDRWDRDRDGVLEGRQHHTLDMELFGPNSWLTGFYLGALLAASEMADHLGDLQTKDEYRLLFEKGSKWVDDNLFNGEYYYQQIDLKDKSILDSYSTTDKQETYRGGRSVTSAYWDAEHEEIKYQVAEGCSIDQLVAQWHANIMGLGNIFDKKQTQRALKAIYDHNFKKDLRDHFNPCRIYALNGEAAVLICAYPRSSPVIAVPYAQEAMNGFEYQAACHMIQEGMVEEGLEIVRAIRDRYDGKKRNPWNEFECGSNYARSMASYSLLLTLSGFSFDMVAGEIGFDPIGRNGDDFRCFWSLDSGWGSFLLSDKGAELTVLWGTLSISSIGLPKDAADRVNKVSVGDSVLPFSTDAGRLRFTQTITIKEGQSLKLT